MNKQQASTPIMTEDRPVSLQGAPGNLRLVPGEDMKNALGAAALLTIVSGMLRAVFEDPRGITEEDFEEIRKTLDFIGTEEDVGKYVESFQAAIRRSSPFRFARFLQDSTTPSQPLAKNALFALPPVPQKRNRWLEDLLQEADEEEGREIAVTSKENLQ